MSRARNSIINKIVTIIGARPQFVKAAVVSRAISSIRPDLHEVIVHTGQHYDKNMSDVFFEELSIPAPAYNLGVGGGTHGENTGRMLERIEKVLFAEKPQAVLVYGDTDSTLAGALAAAKLHIVVAHVEAGLRSFNRRMPEEVNRVLTDQLSEKLFAPNLEALRNLKNEGIRDDLIHVVGDVMYDAALLFGVKARRPTWFDALDLREGSFVLCTVHRASNTDDSTALAEIIQGLGASGLPTVFPVHPRTRQRIDALNIDRPTTVHFVEPTPYLEMLWLEKNSMMIATDSGGVQKEAYFHRKPCITLREETEWNELVSLGVNRLVSANRRDITRALMSDSWNRSGFDAKIFGNGDAGELIAAAI